MVFLFKHQIKTDDFFGIIRGACGKVLARDDGMHKTIAGLTTRERCVGRSISLTKEFKDQLE